MLMQENCYSQSLELCHIQENQDIILLGSNDSFKRSGAKKKKLSTKKKRQVIWLIYALAEKLLSV